MGHEFSIEQYNSQVSAVWRSTLWLSIITVVEVALALVWMYHLYPNGGGPKLWLNSIFIVMSLLKAYFIVGEFMHIRYETRALTLTILVPTLFLVWFLVAFLWEGAAWLDMRQFWGVIMEDHTPVAPAHH